MPYQVKAVVVWVMHLFTWPFGLAAVIWVRLFHSERVFDFWAKALSLIPGRIGQYLRTSFYVQTLKACPYDLAVGFGSFFSHATAEVGREVGVGCFSVIGNAHLEDKVIIASRVSVMSGKYHHGGGVRGRDMRSNELLLETITVGEGTWVAEGCLIMADVGAHCIVSAGSVVTKPVPEGTTAVGNPARFVRYEKSPGVAIG